MYKRQTVHSVYTVGLHDNIGTWYTSNEKKCVWSRKKVLISGMRKDILVAGFLLSIICLLYTSGRKSRRFISRRIIEQILKLTGEIV